MARPKRKKKDQVPPAEVKPAEVKQEEVKPEESKPKNRGLPPIIAEIKELMDAYEMEYFRPPPALTLNHSHYKQLLALRGSPHYTINEGTGRIDLIMGMIYFLDNEDEMTVR